jgi:protein-S-isoprenylcysteine O-methyltransferase Ste14
VGVDTDSSLNYVLGVTNFVVAAEVAYLALAVGGRALIQWRRTGASGIVVRLSTGWERIAAGVLGLGVVAVGAASAVGGGGAGAVRGAIGGGLVAVGILSTLWAQLSMRESWRVGVDHSERTRLVVEGPFRLVRNPIYSSMLAFFAGVAVLLPGFLSAVAAVAMLTGLEIQVRLVEEPFLAGLHGAEYERWARRTGRFLPCLGLRHV